MPSPSPDPSIQSWFTELRKMQAVCVNNSVGKLSLLGFANANIATAIPSPADQNNFLTAVAVATGYADLQTADLTTCKTFRALLDYCHLLENEIFIALRKLSVAALQKANSTTYYAATVTTAFPAAEPANPGSTPRRCSWPVSAPTCYTLPFRFMINAIVDKTGSSMGDVVPQIAVLG